MPESPMVEARMPSDWYQQIQEIAQPAGRKEAEVVREAIAQHFNRTDLTAVKGAIEDLQERVTSLERKLARLGSHQIVVAP